MNPDTERIRKHCMRRTKGDKRRDKAACRDMNPELFFPATQVKERLPRKACSTCPIILEYARYAKEQALINDYPLQDI